MTLPSAGPSAARRSFGGIVFESVGECGQRQFRLSFEVASEVGTECVSEGAPADVVDLRSMDADERVRGNPRLDVELLGSRLFREICGE
jgi:hypothetical protein